jgi:hypothetical protein
MILVETTYDLFKQIKLSLNNITNEQYATKSKLLHSATIGQHVRHVIELFQELDHGYNKGIVNYEKRKRNYSIETDISFAIIQLKKIIESLYKPNLSLILETSYDLENATSIKVQSTYYREIIYNIEHTIHHMALIKIALEQEFAKEVPADYGVATSTIKYKLQCAQ